MTTSSAIAALPTLCATTILPANAVLQFGNGMEPFTLTQEVEYQAPCPTLAFRDLPESFADPDINADANADANNDADPDPDAGADASADADMDETLSEADTKDHRFSDFRDPFYATQFPMFYALAATTVTAYMLVIMLFVTPRSFLDGGIVYLGRRGFTNSSSAHVNIGGRPWLQKVAALSVAICLTVATADSFRVAEEQYRWGIQNARLMQLEVLGSIPLKVLRLISDTFLWLAQAQTLIRLFPRQREKIIIKWAAFALITLDVIFSALNSFKYSVDGVSGPKPPNSFVHPVPALSYLFQLSLGILYAAWVVYYSWMKRRYAFYHPLMKNICLVAIMALASVIIPVTFFILDISKPDFARWGDYVRWVGAAAASVVVWEWVERIEALEREEKKDGILGREVFDGDDTLEVNASEFPWFKQLRNRKGGDGGEGGAPGAPNGAAWTNMSPNDNRQHRQSGQTGHDGDGQQPPGTTSMGTILRNQVWPARPAPIATPVSRTDTASAASTVYAVRYQQPASEATTRTPEPFNQASMVELSRQSSLPRSYHTNEDTNPSNPGLGSMVQAQNGQILPPANRRSVEVDANSSASQAGRRSLTPATQPGVSRENDEPSEEGRQNSSQQQQQQHLFSPARTRSQGSRWTVRARLEEFAANQAERIRERIRPNTDTDNLPVTVIPAPPRRGAALQQVLEEEELREGGDSNGARQSGGSNSRGSMEMSHLDRSRSALSTVSRGPDGLPVTNPPLWPGVQPRHMYDDDESSYDSESMTETSSSIDESRRTFEDTGGPSGVSGSPGVSGRN